MHPNSCLRRPLCLFLACAALWLLTPSLTLAASSASDVGREISNTAEDVWKAAVRRGDPRHLAPGELIAWILLGSLVGAGAAMIATRRRQGFGTWPNLALGLIGALTGGVIVDVLDLQFGWGEVVLRYEEASAALVCSLVLVLGGRWLRHLTGPSRGSKSGDSSS